MAKKYIPYDYEMRFQPLSWICPGLDTEETTGWKVWHRGQWHRLHRRLRSKKPLCIWKQAGFFVVIKDERVWIADHLLVLPCLRGE